MQNPARGADYLVPAGLWLALAVGFIAILDGVSLTLLFAVTALLWTAAPLALTRLETRALIAASLGTLALGGFVFLALVWIAMMFLG